MIGRECYGIPIDLKVFPNIPKIERDVHHYSILYIQNYLKANDIANTPSYFTSIKIPYSQFNKSPAYHIPETLIYTRNGQTAYVNALVLFS